MIINDIPFTADLSEIVAEWQAQLRANHIPYLGVIRDTPDNIMVSCLYHKNGQERKPSAGIKKSDGTYHCFACGEVHSLQEVISYSFGHTDDITGAFGWNWLLKNFVTIEVEERKSIPLDFSRNKSGKSSTKYYVDEDELDKYREYHPYMWKRKMTPDIVEKFDIGYDRDTRCITFPVRDIHGGTLFVARRSVVTKFFNYPSGAEKPVYGLYELSQLYKQPDELIICESMIDAITCWVYGKPAVALNGLGNDLQFKQLNDLTIRKFILATDNDEAGRKARMRLRKNITRHIISEYVLPDGRKDINELSEDEFENLQEIY